MRLISLLITIINSVGNFIFNLYDYRIIYKIIGLFSTRKFKKAKNNHKYAVLVAARNEEAVISKLIESIKKQDYPEELIDIFVVADNCTDKTAIIAKESGAVCYERFDEEHKTKGFALQYLVECISKDYGIEAYEGYFIFDADNLLDKNYIKRMNDSFDSGEKIITSYRNTKNFDTNWISASYAIHWLRTIRNEHRARSLFRFATRIQGTGFLFASELITNGWNYTGLTEDRAFCADAVAKGYRISYNNEAIFYDEQPTDIKIAMRQRIRWAKGHLQALYETGPKLLLHIFITRGSGKPDYIEENLSFKRFLNSIRLRFMSFDMLTVVLPNSLVAVVKKITVFILRVVLISLGGMVISENYAPKFLRKILRFLGISFINNSYGENIVWLAFFFIAWTFSSYFKGILTAIYIFIVENNRIKPIKLYKKLWFAFTFPIFDLIGKISLIIAIFKKVEWKPIPHNAVIDISDLE